MKKFVRVATFAVLVVGSAVSVGCTGVPGGNLSNGPGVQSRYNKLVDPCPQERYKVSARDNVVQPFDAMANNANNLEVTVWNTHFEAGKENLNAAGLRKIDYIARRLPSPVSKVWIQTARDLPYDAANPQKVVNLRTELDAKRCQAVLAYLYAQPNGQAMHYDVQAHDAVDPAMPALGPTNAYRGLAAQFGSSVGGVGGGGAQIGAGGGAAPGTPAAGGNNAAGGNSPTR